MLFSYEGETRDGFHYSILKTDRLKAYQPIFKKLQDNISSSAELGAVMCVCTFPHLSLD